MAPALSRMAQARRWYSKRLPGTASTLRGVAALAVNTGRRLLVICPVVALELLAGAAMRTPSATWTAR